MPRRYLFTPDVSSSSTLSGAVVESATDTATGAISFQHTLGGAVVESAVDTAIGTVEYQHTLGGAVVEVGADIAAGTVEWLFSVAGAVVESGQDTASGAIAVVTPTTLAGAVIEPVDVAVGYVSYRATAALEIDVPPFGRSIAVASVNRRISIGRQ